MFSLKTRFKSSSTAYNAQPFCFSSKGFDFCIAHNGTVDFHKLVERLRISTNLDVLDSYLLGTYIYNELSKLDIHNVMNIYNNVSLLTKSALNTIALLFNNSKIIIIITFFLSNKLLNNSRHIEYYKLYRIDNNNFIAILSSSISVYLNKYRNLEEVPLQSSLIYEIMKWSLKKVMEFKLWNLKYSLYSSQQYQ